MRIISTLLKVLLGILLLAAVVLGVLVFPYIRTFTSIKSTENSLYQMDYHSDYKLDAILASNITNFDDLSVALSKRVFFNHPVELNENLFGCSAFLAESPGNKQIVGRNMDYPGSGALLLYTQPKNDYASYSMVSLEHLNVLKTGEKTPDTKEGKIAMFAAPYLSVDGVNEKGFSASILSLANETTHQQTGKAPIITTVALRMLLDKAATVDEAVTLLGHYDMQSSAGVPYHFFLADKSGNSAVVDWSQQEMHVTPTNHVTNFQLSEGPDHLKGDGHDRYAILETELAAKNNQLTPEEGMDLLQKVCLTNDPNAAQDIANLNNGLSVTQWSVVYNLSDFTATVVKDRQYDAPSHYFFKEK